MDNAPLALAPANDPPAPDATLLLAAADAAMTGATFALAAYRDDVREPGDIALALDACEVAEHLTDALQSILTLELAGTTPGTDRADALGQLLGAVTRFVEGWA